MIGDSFHIGPITHARLSSNRIAIDELAYAEWMDDFESSSPGYRLRWARKRAGFKTADAAARAVKMNPVNYRAYENDQHGYSKHVVLFSKTFGVSAEWLLEGGTSPAEGAAGNVFQLPLPDKAAMEEIEMIRKVDIAYAMGDGSVVEDYPETDFMPFSLEFLRKITKSNTDKIFIATTIGDSMEPTLRRNDLVMIDTGQTRLGMNDDIYAISYAGTGMVKRVRRLTGGRIQLLSDNPAVPTLDASEEEIYLVGKVVWSARVV